MKPAVSRIVSRMAEAEPTKVVRVAVPPAPAVRALTLASSGEIALSSPHERRP
jgi:hypothetical protein